MKGNLAIYLTVFSLMCACFVSCGDSDENVGETSPYAFVRSFSLGNIRSSYPSFTSKGKDTTIVMTMSMESFPFTIDQVAGAIYNNDSLPYATDVSKVVTNIVVEGVPSIFDEAKNDYVAYKSTDSINFTAPRKMRIYSSDAKYFKDYTVTVNVHKLKPDEMVWNRSVAVEGVTPRSIVEFGGKMCMFGVKDASPVVATTPLDGEPVWAVAETNGLPAEGISQVVCFNGALYALANGDLYVSSDAVEWSPLLVGKGLLAIVSSSTDAGALTVADGQVFMSSTDGVSFESDGTVPAGFPLYGVSVLSYPLSHNRNIIRYIVVGYDTPEMDDRARVWSRLSNEDEWVDYENAGQSYTCPSLKNLAVVRFDNYLYAMGGAGKANGEDVTAFASFFISKDNGITWKEPSDFYQRMNKELAGFDKSFATAVDSNNFMWIVTPDATWKIIINRLGFNKK